jgi:hypothetical protein
LSENEIYAYVVVFVAARFEERWLKEKKAIDQRKRIQVELDAARSQLAAGNCFDGILLYVS